jgi:hypothetical protein
MSEPEATVPAPAASRPAPPPFSPRVPTRRELFLGFATIAICGFGGVLAWARRIVVQRRAWMTAEEFNEQLALCQILPGGNIVNFSIMFGYVTASCRRCAACSQAWRRPPPDCSLRP